MKAKYKDRCTTGVLGKENQQGVQRDGVEWGGQGVVGYEVSESRGRGAVVGHDKDTTKSG